MNKDNLKEIEKLNTEIDFVNEELTREVEKINELRNRVLEKFISDFDNSTLTISFNKTFTKMEFDAKRENNVLSEFGVLIDIRTNKIIKKVFENPTFQKNINDLKELEKNIVQLVQKINISKVKKTLNKAKKIGKIIDKKDKEKSELIEKLEYVKTKKELDILNQVIYLDPILNMKEVFKKLETEEINFVLMKIYNKVISFRDVRIIKKEGKRKLYEVNGRIMSKEKIKGLLEKKITTSEKEIEYQSEIVELLRLPEPSRGFALTGNIEDFLQPVNEFILRNKVREF